MRKTVECEPARGAANGKNVVNPETYNDDINFVFNVPSVNIAPLNTAGNLNDPSVDVQSNLPVGFIDTIGFVVFCVNLELSAINNNVNLFY